MRQPFEEGVVAVVASDLHLTLEAPLARSTEKDWLGVQAHYLDKIKEASDKYKKVPILYPGDIFHKWNASAELIGWAIAHLPFGYAIPGQHDLPQHNYEAIKRSAYWVLVEAGKLVNLAPGGAYPIDGLMLYGFPWGFDLQPCPDPKGDFGLRVAIVHSYLWIKGFQYFGAPKDKRLSAFADALKGYDAAFFGDNHFGFQARKSGVNVCNCGTLLRRRSQEKEYVPCISLLMHDGSIKREELDVSKDVFAPVLESLSTPGGVDVEGLVDDLKALADRHTIDYVEVLQEYMGANSTRKKVRELVMACLEKKYGA